MKNLKKPTKYSDVNVEFYGMEVNPVSGVQTPGGYNNQQHQQSTGGGSGGSGSYSGSGGSGGYGGYGGPGSSYKSFSEILNEIFSENSNKQGK